MVANLELVRHREGRVRAFVRDLQAFSSISKADFLGNRERQYAVLHALQLAIEASIEIATHICSADGHGVPSTYAEAFALLEQAGVVDPPLAGRLKAMARFRNRLVHFYGEVDLEQVYEILQGHLGDFAAYLKAIERYLAGGS